MVNLKILFLIVFTFTSVGENAYSKVEGASSKDMFWKKSSFFTSKEKKTISNAMEEDYLVEQEKNRLAGQGKKRWHPLLKLTSKDAEKSRSVAFKQWKEEIWPPDRPHLIEVLQELEETYKPKK